ncbi:MAG: hypothetical protein K2K86_01670 [Muribaculaceae bacterium]|nr:hypothetical protein [Muribaculaceae bacterium]
MKKSLLSLIALFGLGTALHAQDNVTNLTTNVGYPTLTEAFNAAESNDVLQVNNDISMDKDSRSGVKPGYVYTIKGANPDVVITRNNTSQNQLFLLSNTNATINFQDLIFDGGRITNKPEIIAMESANTVLNMTNVLFRNVTTTSANVINLKNNNKYTINLNNVKFEGSIHTVEADANCDIPVKSNTTLTLAGDNNLTIYYEGAATVKVADEGITNTTPIVLKVDNIVGKVAVQNCTDPSKFTLTNPELSLVVKNGNLVVEGKSVVVTTPGIEVEGITGCNFASINDVVAAVEANAQITKDNNVVLTLYMDQTVGTRAHMKKQYTVAPAEGKNITINANATNIAFLVEGGILNMSDVKVVNGLNKNAFETKTGGSLIALTNVDFECAKVTDNNQVRVMGGAKVTLDNINVTDWNSSKAFLFLGASGSNLIGNSTFSIDVENNYNFNGADWTPAGIVDIYFTFDPAKPRNINTTLINGFTDVLKLNLMADSEKYALVAANGNIEVWDPVHAGIDNVDADEVNAPVEYFNLQGVRVENPTTGLYIKKQGNKVYKVVL